MKIGKDFVFEAAHRLQRHDGKCKNLHGHSYKVQVAVAGVGMQEEGPQTGMLFDFGVLSEWWKANEALLDHATILEEGDPLVAAISTVPGQRMVLFSWPPTAEHLAVWLRNDLENWLRDKLRWSSWTVTVRVYETAKSWAEA